MMRFKEFLQIEDANSQETGLFANIQAKDTGHRVPSDGIPFAQYLSISSGAKPGQSGNMGGGMPTGGGGMFMAKKMKKKMKLK